MNGFGDDSRESSDAEAAAAEAIERAEYGGIVAGGDSESGVAEETDSIPIALQMIEEPFEFHPDKCCELKCEEIFAGKNLYEVPFRADEITDAISLSHAISASRLYTPIVDRARNPLKRKKYGARLHEPRKTDSHISSFTYRLWFEEGNETRVCKRFFLETLGIDRKNWDYALTMLARSRRLLPRNVETANRIDFYGSLYTLISSKEPYYTTSADFTRKINPPLDRSRMICRIRGTGVRDGDLQHVTNEIFNLSFVGYFFSALLNLNEWHLKWQRDNPRPEDPNARKRTCREGVADILRFSHETPSAFKTYASNVHLYWGKTSPLRIMPSTIGDNCIALSVCKKEGGPNAHTSRIIREEAVSNGLFFHRPECSMCYASAGKKWMQHLPSAVRENLAPTPTHHMAMHLGGSFAQERLLEAESLLFEHFVTAGREADKNENITLQLGSFAMDLGVCESRLPRSMYSDETMDACDPRNNVGVFVCADSLFATNEAPSLAPTKEPNPETGHCVAVLVNDVEAEATKLAIAYISRHSQAIEMRVKNFVLSPAFKELQTDGAIVLHLTTIVRMSAMSGYNAHRLSLRVYFTQEMHAMMQRVNSFLTTQCMRTVFILNAQLHEAVTAHAASSFVPVTMDRILRYNWLSGSEYTDVPPVYDTLEGLCEFLSKRMPHVSWCLSKDFSTETMKVPFYDETLMNFYKRAGAIRLLCFTRYISPLVREHLFASQIQPLVMHPAKSAYDRVKINTNAAEIEASIHRWAMIHMAMRAAPNAEASCFISRAITSGSCPCDVTEKEFIDGINGMLRGNTDSAVYNAFTAAACSFQEAPYERLIHMEPKCSIKSGVRISEKHVEYFCNNIRKRMKVERISLGENAAIVKRPWGKK